MVEVVEVIVEVIVLVVVQVVVTGGLRILIVVVLVVLVDVGSDVEIDVGEAGPLSEKKVWQAGVGVGVGVLYVVDHVGVYCAVKFPLDAVMYVTMLV